MPRLKANFGADWVTHLRALLVNVQGWSAAEVALLDDRDVRFHYFDAQRRRISIGPRTIRIADDFVCPPEHEAGWRMLQEEVRNGLDINPRLSKRHSSLLNSDGLLAEWGVHHFHLGVARDPRDSDYVGRTGPLVYAMVRDKDFYAINVCSHGDFEDSNILESIHRNWPEAIQPYRRKGVTGGSWAPSQRRDIRRKNGNVLSVTADGTVYMPIGGPVMASGVKAEAVWLADYWQIKIDEFQTNFEKQLQEVLPALKRQGYAGEDDLDAKLIVLSDTAAQVLFPKYEVLVNVALTAPAAQG